MTQGQDSAEEQRARDTRKLGRQGGLNLLGSLVAASLHLVLPVLVTRSLSQSEAGLFFQAIALFAMVMVLGVFGADTGLLRYLPRALAQRNAADVRVTLRASLVAPVLTALLVAVSVVLLADPIAGLVIEESDQAQSFADAVTVLAAAVPVAVLYSLALSASRGLGSVFGLVVIEKVGRGVLQVLLAGGAVLVTGSLIWLTVGWAVPYLIALVVLGFWISGRLRGALHRIESAEGVSPAPTGGLTREFWRFSAPRAVSRGFSVALQRADILLVGALRGPEDAAVYAVVTRFPVLGLMFVQAIQQVMAPRISEFLTIGARDRAVLLYQTTTAWLVLVSWPIYLVSAAFAPLLLSIFGEGYDQAWVPVVVLCLVMLIATGCGPVDMVLLMGGRSVLSLFNTGLALVVMVSLDLVLIPAYGVLGAAIGWSAAIATNNLLPLIQVHRTMGMQPISASTVRAAGLTVLVGAAALMVRLLLGANVLGLLVAGALTAVCFVAGLWWWRVPLELDALLASLRRRRGNGERRTT